LTKALLQSSTALNLAMFLLLKADQPSQEEVDPSLIQSHPVMARLQKLNALMQHLEDRVEKHVPGLSEQLSNLVEAAALLNSGAVDKEDEERAENATNDESDDASAEEEDVGSTEKNQQQSEKQLALSSSPDDDDDSSSDAAVEERRVLTEARFGLRQDEISSKPSSRNSKQRRALDFGDGSSNDATQKAARSLASTVNTIEQKTASRKRRASPLADEIDETQGDDDELRRGIAMMEEEFGKDFDKDDDKDSDDGDADDAKYDAELEDDDDEGFYAQVSKKSKSLKASKSAKYAVAPKFPRVEREIQGERAINKTILKNRGLVAHKSKLNRNPRVKKREQYRKAVIRRKGAVREVRKDEGHKYGGEETGIKSAVSRSRKLAR
jgi:U3 small nucleolar RNA-associated protein 3